MIMGIRYQESRPLGNGKMSLWWGSGFNRALLRFYGYWARFYSSQPCRKITLSLKPKPALCYTPLRTGRGAARERTCMGWQGGRWFQNPLAPTIQSQSLSLGGGPSPFYAGTTSPSHSTLFHLDCAFSLSSKGKINRRGQTKSGLSPETSPARLLVGVGLAPMTVASSKGLPPICNPMGIPSSPDANPQGRLYGPVCPPMDGRVVTMKGRSH